MFPRLGEGVGPSVYLQERANAVHDEKAVLARCEVLAKLGEQFMLIFAIPGTGGVDVLHSSLTIDPKALGDLYDTLRTKGAFSVLYICECDEVMLCLTRDVPM